MSLWELFGDDITNLEKLHACSGESCQVCAMDDTQLRAKFDKRAADIRERDIRKGRHRNPDWSTSIIAAEKVSYRAGSQKSLLLEAYRNAYPRGLTDDEAAMAAGLPLTSCYWKRCGELRQDGVIVAGEPRVSRQNGETRIECFYVED